MGFVNRGGDGVADARREADIELAPTNWGGVCPFMVSLYA